MNFLGGESGNARSAIRCGKTDFGGKIIFLKLDGSEDKKKYLPVLVSL